MRMNEGVIKATLIKMKAGERRTTRWFADQGLSKSDLNDAVERDYLVYYEKDMNDFMSDDGYELTRAGRDFAWSKQEKSMRL